MKPLVKWLKVKRAAVGELLLIEKVQNKVRAHGYMIKNVICVTHECELDSEPFLFSPLDV